MLGVFSIFMTIWIIFQCSVKQPNWNLTLFIMETICCCPEASSLNFCLSLPLGKNRYWLAAEILLKDTSTQTLGFYCKHEIICKSIAKISQWLIIMIIIFPIDLWVIDLQMISPYETIKSVLPKIYSEQIYLISLEWREPIHK